MRKMLRGVLACSQFSSLVSICNWTVVEVCRKPVWFIILFFASASWTSCVSDAVFTTSTTYKKKKVLSCALCMKVRSHKNKNQAREVQTISRR